MQNTINKNYFRYLKKDNTRQKTLPTLKKEKERRRKNKKVERKKKKLDYKTIGI